MKNATTYKKGQEVTYTKEKPFCGIIQVTSKVAKISGSHMLLTNGEEVAQVSADRVVVATYREF